MILLRSAILKAAFLLICSAKWGQSVRVEFYGEENYKGFLEEKVLTGTAESDCVYLSSFPYPRSIKTDKCLILYTMMYPGCYEPNNVFTATRPNNVSTATSTNPNHKVIYRINGNTPSFDLPLVTQLLAFNVCSQKHGGGNQLDIDIRKFLAETNLGEESWRGVCGCTNVPSRLVAGQVFQLMINNFGNSVNVYEGENCQGRSKYVAAGMDYETLTGYYGFDVRSFKPAELKNCYKLDAKIHEFHFKNGTDSINDLPTEDVQLATNSDITNNGASEITQTFKVRSSITETVEFSVAESFTTMHTAGTEIGVAVETEVGVPLFAKAKVTAEVTANYQWSQENSGETSNTTTISQEEEIEIVQEIKIPPCKVCHITTFVKKIKDFPVKYTAYAKVSAAENEKPITAEELKKNLPAGMDYVKDINQYTVEGRTEGTMYVDFGLKSLVNVNCDAGNIPGCTPGAYSPSDDHRVYEGPIHFVNKLRSPNSRPTFLSFLKNSIELIVKQLN